MTIELIAITILAALVIALLLVVRDIRNSRNVVSKDYDIVSLANKEKAQELSKVNTTNTSLKASNTLLQKTNEELTNTNLSLENDITELKQRVENLKRPVLPIDSKLVETKKPSTKKSSKRSL